MEAMHSFYNLKTPHSISARSDFVSEITRRNQPVRAKLASVFFYFLQVEVLLSWFSRVFERGWLIANAFQWQRLE